MRRRHAKGGQKFGFILRICQACLVAGILALLVDVTTSVRCLAQTAGESASVLASAAAQSVGDGADPAASHAPGSDGVSSIGLPATAGGWLLLGVGILLMLVVPAVVGAVVGKFAAWHEKRRQEIPRQIWRSMLAPGRLLSVAVGMGLVISALSMTGEAARYGHRAVLFLVYMSLLWFASNALGILDLLFPRVVGRTGAPIDESLGPFVRKTLRTLLWVFGALFIASSVFQQDITAWLTGLGIAGLAVSLAAQDSLKNLFGSVTILADRPFRIGERIVFAGYDGVIEEVGFRSTRLRTLTGHLVTIPNSKITNEAIENISRRPSIRRLFSVTITYDTPVKKVRRAVEIIRNILEEDGIREPIHPVINGDEFPPRVYFNEFNPDSLNILVIYWYAPPSYWDFLAHAERVNLRIMEEFEKEGIEFAFPTQTLYLAGDMRRRLAVEVLSHDLPR